MQMTQGSGVSIKKKKKKSGLWIYKLHTVKNSPLKKIIWLYLAYQYI